MKFKAPLAVAAGVAALTLGLVAGSALTAGSSEAGPRYPSNADGLTYGSATEAQSAADEPELIQAIGVNGVEGYVYRDELNAYPEQGDRASIERWMERVSTARSIPVFAVDGKTRIDTFVIESNRSVPEGDELERLLEHLDF